MRLPTKTSFKTTAFGVRARELAIAGAAGFTGLALLALPLGSIFVRILLAAGLSGAGVTYAFWRVGRVWTIEGYLANRLKFGRRGRRFLKGNVSADGTRFPSGGAPGAGADESGPIPADPAAAAVEAAAAPEASETGGTYFWLSGPRRPHTLIELAGTVAALVSVIAFLAWIVTTDGVQTIQGQLQIVWLALWLR